MWSTEENAVMQVVVGAIKGCLSPEHGATGSCEQPRECWEPSPGPLQGPHTLWTTEPQLQPQALSSYLERHRSTWAVLWASSFDGRHTPIGDTCSCWKRHCQTWIKRTGAKKRTIQNKTKTIIHVYRAELEINISNCNPDGTVLQTRKFRPSSLRQAETNRGSATLQISNQNRTPKLWLGTKGRHEVRMIFKGKARGPHL